MDLVGNTSWIQFVQGVRASRVAIVLPTHCASVGRQYLTTASVAAAELTDIDGRAGGEDR